MSALDAMTGIIPVTMVAGVNLAVLKEVFPGGATGRGYASKPYKGRRQTRRTNRRRQSGHPGNFSNVGL